MTLRCDEMSNYTLYMCKYICVYIHNMIHVCVCAYLLRVYVCTRCTHIKRSVHNVITPFAILLLHGTSI